MSDPRGVWLKVLIPRGRASLQWMDAALCTQVGDDDIWFPAHVGSTRQAKAICRQCPVIAECLEWAVSDSSLQGILGGTTNRERMGLRRRRRADAEVRVLRRGSDVRSSV